jgi:hypothetical protein
MLCVGLEPTIPASERTKTVHASDRAATVTGHANYILYKLVLIIFITWISQNASALNDDSEPYWSNRVPTSPEDRNKFSGKFM